MKTYKLEMTEKGKLFFDIFNAVFGEASENNAPIDPEQERKNLLKTENEEWKQMFFEFGVNEFIDAINSIGELADSKNDTKNMKKLVRYLKYDLESRIDACGEEDDLIVAPAKKAYKRAKRIYKHMKGTPCD